MLRFPLQLPPVVKPKRHLVRTYFLGAIGVFLALMGLILLAGLMEALR